MARGLEALLRRFDGTRPEFALLLVKTTLGSVVSGLADAYGMMPLLEDAPVKVATSPRVDPGGWMAAVQIREEPWVTVYVALGEVAGLDQELTRQVAADLSETFSTDAIALVITPDLLEDEETRIPETDSADREAPDPEEAGPEGAAQGEPRIRFELFSGGESVDLVQWRAEGPIETFRSELRERPGNAPVPLELVNDLVADRGILVPAACPRNRGDSAFLDLWDLDPERVEQADLFRLRGSSFFDEETLEMSVSSAPASDESPESSTLPLEESNRPLPSPQDAAPPPAVGLRGLLQRFLGLGCCFPGLG
ncbi:MAG: hypothetical protein AAF725_02675 [Acidobacteriota bacterium]